MCPERSAMLQQLERLVQIRAAQYSIRQDTQHRHAYFAESMARLHGVFLPLLALLSVVSTGVYVYDLWRTSDLPSGCEMTYSWPVYTPLEWSKATSKHRKYQLYSVHMKQHREALTGVPVLFVPGHLGSYKQARSIARHLSDADADLFDVFAVEFQEELSGLSGNFVHQQAQYVNDAIRSILRQYKKQQQSELKKKGKNGKNKKVGSRVPESVVIVAHSMGGVVVRLAETLPNYKSNSIQHVISLGAPYNKPPFPFDAEMQSVYTKITKKALPVAGSSDAAIDEDAATSSLPVYISIAGGHKDMVVHASLSITDRIIHSKRSVASLTTAMPSVQLTMDHLCLLWCHQLLDRIAKSLVAVVDLETRELVKSPAKRLETSREILLGGDDLVGEQVDAASVLLHREHLLDGYHIEEFTKYGLLLPKLVFHLLRTSYATVFILMYALALHIFSLQVAHWQGCFSLQASPETQPAQGKFPSFTSMLHPAAHLPPFAKNALAALTRNVDGSRNTTVVAMLSVVAVGGLGLLVEFGRRNPLFVVQYGFVVELGFLYLYAIGLLYAISVLCSLVHALVVSRIVSALHRLVVRAKVQRWMIIGSIVAVVFLLGQIQRVSPFQFVASMDSSRNLALLVVASYVVFIMYLVALGGDTGTPIDQQRVQRSLFVIYVLSVVPWTGKILYFVDIVRFPPPHLSNDLLLEGGSYVALLALARYLVTLSQECMLPLPPTAFFGSSTGQDAGSAYDDTNSSSSGSTTTKITAENCPKCIFEDGGPGAIFIEFTNQSTKRLVKNKEVVLVGPSFRAVSCDCVTRFASPREFCDFCTRSCRLCGGGSGNYQQAQKYREFLEDKQTQVAMHALIPFAFELLALVQITYGLSREHLSFYFTPICTLVLLVYHVALLSPVEAKRRKNKLSKPKKKKRKSKSKASANSSAAPSSTSSTTTKPPPATGKRSDKPSTSAKSGGKKGKDKESAKESIWVNPVYELADPSEQQT